MQVVYNRLSLVACRLTITRNFPFVRYVEEAS